MRILLLFFLVISINGLGQWKSYIIGIKGDTLNRVDMNGKKQGPWWVRVEALRGERGYEEEGYYVNDRKEGLWKRYSLMGDKLAEENYRWGNKDGKCRYYTATGGLLREESWKAVNPDNPYDTVDVYDLQDPTKVIDRVRVKLDGYSLKHGEWKYYDPYEGVVIKTERYWLDKESNTTATADVDDDLTPIDVSNAKSKSIVKADTLGKKSIPKPAAVLEYEKKKSGKKNIKVRDGRTGL
jgi:hypothetical protein